MLWIYDQARSYLLAHIVPLRPSLQEIQTLCKEAGEVFSYAQGQAVIETLGATEYMILDAFTMFRKGKPLIFYKDSLGYAEKIFPSAMSWVISPWLIPIMRGTRIRDPFIYAYQFQALTGLRPGELIGLE